MNYRQWLTDLIKPTGGKILFWLYLSAVLILNAFLMIFQNRETVWGFIGLSLVIMVFAWFVSSLIFYAIEKIPVAQIPDWSWKQKSLSFLGFFVLFTAAALLWYFAIRPGSANTDHIEQALQIAGEKPYSDWHPIWHTIVFFLVPYKLTGNVFSGVLPQMILVAFALALICESVSEFSGKKAGWICFVWLLFNPYIFAMSTYPFKDIAMALCAVFATVIILRIVLEKKQSKWIWFQVILIGFFMANATIFRHNAFLYTIPLVLALILYLGWKKWLVLVAAMASVFLLIKGPVYSSFEIEQPGHRTVETSGLPLNIIFYAYLKNEKALDPAIISSCKNTFVDEEAYENYELGNFNLVKWDGVTDFDNVDEIGTLGMFKLAAKTILEAPVAGLKALIKTTSPVYTIEGTLPGVRYALFNPSLTRHFEIEYEGNENLLEFLNGTEEVISRTRLNIFYYLGTTILVLLALILCKSRLSKKERWKRIALVLPVLLYDFGTMMALTGPDVRFFVINFYLLPLLMILLHNPGREVIADCQPGQESAV